MNPNDPNVVLLELVAQRLGDLRHEFVFVGGAVAGMLITDPAQPAIRPTEDVDLIVQVLARPDYYDVEERLRQQGFSQDLSRDAPICRWRIDSVIVDVMPTLKEILNFSNRWYPLAAQSAQLTPLPSGTQIRLITAPVFIATKLEAFVGRGNNDYLFSHDLGDLLAVVDGRDTLVDECRGSDPVLRGYLGQRFSALLASRPFREALPGHLPGDLASQARLPDLEEKLHLLAQLSDAGT